MKDTQKDTILDISLSALFDIRVESLAAVMLAAAGNGTAPDLTTLIVSPLGNARRRSHPEVEEVRQRQRNGRKAIILEVNKKGFYDILPEHLFLGLRPEKEYPSAKARVEAFQEQIQEARTFFLPFEQSLYWPRIESELEEQHLTEHFPGFIEKMWGLPAFSSILSRERVYKLCILLPLAHQVSGDWEMTRLCFVAVLGYPVEIKLVAPTVFMMEGGQPDELSLGDECMLGDSFQDDLPALEVHIHDVPAEALSGFLFEGQERRILEELLYQYFLPLELSVTTIINMKEEAFGLELGHSTLGYDVVI